MVNKFFKALVGALAMVAALSAMPAASMDAAACNDDVAVCADCEHQHYKVEDVVLSDDWISVGGDQHVTSVEYYYRCLDCKVVWVEIHNVYGAHSYQYNYSANEWVCTVCGDSYTN